MNSTDPKLILVDPPEGFQALSFPLDEGMSRIGRSAKNDLRLRDKTVSRSHCYLERVGGDVRLYDLGSQNGTWVGGAEANGAALNDGDVVGVGRFKLLFRAALVASPPPAPVDQQQLQQQVVPQQQFVPQQQVIPQQQVVVPQQQLQQAPVVPGQHVAMPGQQVAMPGQPVAMPQASGGPQAVAGQATAPKRRTVPRRRRPKVQAKRSQGLEVVVVVAILAGGLGFAIWMLNQGRDPVPARGTADSAQIQGLRDELDTTRSQLASKLAALEKLERSLVSTQDSSSKLRATATKELESLLSEISTLEAREKRLRSTEREDAKLLAAKTRRERREIIEELAAGDDRWIRDSERSDAGEDGHDHGSDDLDDLIDEEKRTGITEVVNLPPPDSPYATRGKKDITNLVAEVMAGIEDYASPSTTPERLDPHLGELSSTAGREAAEGLFACYHHARDLLKEIDDNLTFLKKRNEALEREAGALKDKDEKRGKKKEGSSYGGGVGEEVVKKQMVLELSSRKIRIKEEQRGRLVQLRDKLLATFTDRTDFSSTQRLAHHFVAEKDTVERLAILEGLATARDPRVIPILTAKLGTTDKEIRGAILRTLRRITGEDLGDKRRSWDRWWHENKPKEEVEESEESDF